LKTVFHTLSNTHLFGASAGNGRLAILVLDGAALATGELDGSDDLVRLDIALGNAAKDDVLAIKPGGDDSGDKKLRAVGVGASVGHGQQERTVVPELEVLVGKLLAIDGLAAGAVATSKVTALKHEIWDHTVELGALVSKALLACAESTEVLGRLGNNVVEDFKVDTASLGFYFALLGDIASVVHLDFGAGPGAIKVSFDSHVVCRRGEEAFVDRSAKLGNGTEGR